MDGMKDGSLGESALPSNAVAPQQVRQESSKLQGIADHLGAGHLAFSKPNNAQKNGGGSGVGGACDTGGGGDDGGYGSVGVSAQDARVRRGKGGSSCVSWTDDERVALYECYQRTGGVKKGGYIKRTKELYDHNGLPPRSGPSISTQLKRIEEGAMSSLVRDEIRKRVRMEVISEKVEAGVGLQEDEIIDVFGESFDGEYDYMDFSLDENDASIAMAEEGDPNQGVGVDFLVEGVPLDPTADEVDTWKESDGTIRLLTVEEKDVLLLLRKIRDNGEWKEVPNLRAYDRRKVMREVNLVDGVMHNMISQNMHVTDINRLLYAGGAVVALRLGLKLGGGKRAEMKKPWWQRRLESSIEMWRKHVAQVEQVRRGKQLNTKVREELERKYQLTERGTKSVSSFLKNKIQAGSTKIRWFVEKKVARRQNNLFRNNQKQLFNELSGNANSGTDEPPDAAESRKFWSEIWSVEMEHDREASWLGDIRKQMKDVQRMTDIVVDVEGVKKGIGRMSNWKAPGPDMVRGFWFKKFDSLHGALTNALKACVEQGEVPEWMVKGRTVLFQKDPEKGTDVQNYRPIACLPLMWKLLTGIFADKIYDHLQANNLLVDEQKGCRRQSRGTKDQLLIDREVLREAKRKKRFLSMAWIDYRKAYDMLPHSWILETLGMIKVAKNIEGLLMRSMADWKTVLTANGKILGDVDIRRGIFQGDTLSPLLFVVAMIPLTLLLRKEKMGYQFGNDKQRINHLLFMDDLKLFGGNLQEIEKLCDVVYKFSRDIGMEFGMNKCAVLEMRKGAKVMCKGIELPDGEVMQEVEEGGYKYLGVLEADGLMTKKMKRIVQNEYLRRVKKVARSRLYARSLISSINVWAVSVVRYTAGILDWKEKELQALDVKTRKILTTNGAFHMRSSVDRLYLKRQEGGRGLMSVEECVRKEELGLHEYVNSSGEWMLKVVADCMGEAEPKADFEKRVVQERWQRLRDKKLHGKFFSDIKDIAHEKSWQWLRGGFVDKRTEGFVCAAQENVIPTRLYCTTVIKDGGGQECRMCGEEAESVGHLVSHCKSLRQTEFKKRHDKMGLRVYWEVCGRHGIQRCENWYEEAPDPVRKSADGRYEVLWDQKVSTPTAFEANRPDLILIDHVDKKWKIIDFAVPFDRNVLAKEEEKVTKYKDLAAEVCRMNSVKVEVVPIVVGALGVVTKHLIGWLKKIGVGDVVGALQTSAIIGTSAILRKVLATDTS